MPLQRELRGANRTIAALLAVVRRGRMLALPSLGALRRRR